MGAKHMIMNVGSADRVLRVVAGIGIVSVGVFYQNWWGAVGLVPMATGLTGWCPPYSLFGINTCSMKKVDS